MNNILRCAFCDAEYPSGTPPTQHEALTEHIKICPKHPMRTVEKETVTKTVNAIRAELLKVSEGEYDSWGFVAAFLDIIDRAEKKLIRPIRPVVDLSRTHIPRLIEGAKQSEKSSRLVGQSEPRF